MKDYLMKRFGLSVDMIQITIDTTFYREDDVLRTDEGNLHLISLKLGDKIITSKINWFGKLIHKLL